MRWRWPWQHKPAQDVGAAAAREKLEARRRLHEDKKRWSEVYEARDLLAELAERAMRGRP